MLLRDTDPPVVPPPEARRRTLDNPRLVTVAVLTLLALLAALVWLSERTGAGEFVSPMLSGVLLYFLSAVDLTILAALLFVLVRNLIKLWDEQRRALHPFVDHRNLHAADILDPCGPAVAIRPPLQALEVRTPRLESVHIGYQRIQRVGRQRHPRRP